MWLDFAYVVASVVVCIHAAVRNEGASFRRLVLFASALIATDAVTILTQVFFVATNLYMQSVFPHILYLSIHASAASSLLYFMRSERRQEYKVIDVDGDDVLEVDSGSSDEFTDDFAE
jgi:hypothetical protein